jgi:hypothetical protein
MLRRRNSSDLLIPVTGAAMGIELSEVDDDELGFRLTEAWRLIGPRKSPRLKRQALIAPMCTALRIFPDSQ